MTRGILWLAAVGLAVLLTSSANRAADKEKGDAPVVLAEALAKEYATDPDAFDKKYKGRVVTVEGMVTHITRPGPLDKEPFCVLAGYTKPGERFGVQVNCTIGAGFEGVRIGHKVRVKGAVEGHSKTRLAAVLKDCTVVKVLADDFPPSKEAAAAVKTLQGKWKVTAVEGTKATANQLGVEEIEVDGYQMVWRAFTGKKEGVTGREILFGLSVDPAKKPKEMTLYLSAGSLPGLYELDGDKLRVCVPLLAKSLKDAKRPTELAIGADGLVVITAERTK